MKCLMKNLLKKKTCQFVFLVMFFMLASFIPRTIFAVPSISSINGTVSNGQPVTISGSAFGSTGPIIAIFDDFEKGTNNNELSTLANSAAVNQWYRLENQGKNPVYSTYYANSGTKSAMIDWGTDNASEGGRWFEADIGSITSQVYVQYWFFVPIGGHVPGANSGGGPNWKLMLISGRPWPRSDYTQVILTDVNNWPMGAWGFICLSPWYDGSGLTEMTSAIGGYHDEGYCSLNPSAGTWHRMEVFMSASSTGSGTMYTAEMNANQTRRIVGSSSNATTLHSGDSWNLVRFPAYGRGDSTSKTYYDDIYIATGSAAQARVEIGNNPTYSTCTKLAITTPTFWSNTSITTTIRTGSFKNGDIAYLYVIDANGLVNTQGYPIIVGGEGWLAPNPPTGLRLLE